MDVKIVTAAVTDDRIAVLLLPVMSMFSLIIYLDFSLLKIIIIIDNNDHKSLRGDKK